MRMTTVKVFQDLKSDVPCSNDVVAVERGARSRKAKARTGSIRTLGGLRHNFVKSHQSTSDVRSTAPIAPTPDEASLSNQLRVVCARMMRANDAVSLEKITSDSLRGEPDFDKRVRAMAVIVRGILGL